MGCHRFACPPLQPFVSLFVCVWHRCPPQKKSLIASCPKSWGDVLQVPGFCHVHIWSLPFLSLGLRDSEDRTSQHLRACPTPGGEHFVLVANGEQLAEMCAALPRTWAAPRAGGKAWETCRDVAAFVERVDADCRQLGKECPWTRLGESSKYLRPHIVRKVAWKAAAHCDCRSWARMSRAVLDLVSSERQQDLGEVPHAWSVAEISFAYRCSPFLMPVWLSLLHQATVEPGAQLWLEEHTPEEYESVASEVREAKCSGSASPRQVVMAALHGSAAASRAAGPAVSST